MALYLVRATPGKREQMNSSQVNGYIVDAVDEAAARAAAAAAAPNGESKPKARWEASLLSALTPPMLIVGKVVIPANGERLPGA
jgi:hypothetical protein